MTMPKFDEINVGDALPELNLGVLTREGIAAFAHASGDMNPIHLDEEAAKANKLPGIIAHGMLNMAFLSRVVTGWVPQSQLRGLETRFAAMAFPGDTVVCRGEVSGKREDGGEKLADLTIELVNGKGETLLAGGAIVALS